MLKFIGFNVSLFVCKVCVVMVEKKIDYEFILEDVWSVLIIIQESNLLGKVFCLLMDDGGVMFDLWVIVEYFDILMLVGKLLLFNGCECVEIKCWEVLVDGVLDVVVLVCLEKILCLIKQQSLEWIKCQWSKVEVLLKVMVDGLGEKFFCVGNYYILVDVVVGCVLGWLVFCFLDLVWCEDYL